MELDRDRPENGVEMSFYIQGRLGTPEFLPIPEYVVQSNEQFWHDPFDSELQSCNRTVFIFNDRSRIFYTQ